MGLAFEIIEGSQVGRVFPVRDGHVLGRTTGEIRIKDDARISSAHARVQKDARGGLLLVDEGSSNGLQINGATVRRIKILPGVQFYVGKTKFKVIEIELDLPVETPELDSESKSWQDVFSQTLATLELKNTDPNPVFGPFSPLLQLLFVEGLQADQEVILGFGPRHFGSDSLDIELHDPLSPPIAFILEPTPAGPQLRTQFPKLVRVNGQSNQEQQLQPGDKIQVGHTLIEVRFLT